MRNQFGLGRDIPASIKREVRQRDGFGCIICGKAIYDYEHFDPEFSNAKVHCAAGIVLLCIACHGKRTRGFLSKDTIEIARANPKCKQQGFSFEEFDVGMSAPQIVLGTFVAQNVETLIQIDGHQIFSILPPLGMNLPFRINAHLTDRNGAKILKIVDNEWQSANDNWDVETGGGKIVIRRSLGDVVLALRSDPPNRLLVEHLNMYFQGTTIRCSENQHVEVVTPSGRVLSCEGMFVNGCKVGIQVDANGIKLGVGGGSVLIESMTINNSPPRFLNASRGVRRNELCPCGKGRKYKHCCGKY